MADRDQVTTRVKLMEGWVITAARLVRAKLPADEIFETMAAVAVTGLLRSWNRTELAVLLRTWADLLDSGQEQKLETMIRRLGEKLGESRPA